MTESPPRILADIRDEAESIGAEVAAADLPVRLLGGVAFWLRCRVCARGRLPATTPTWTSR